MCLITTKREPKTTQEDMVVYKFLVGEESSSVVTSPFEGFPYKLGELYTTKMKESGSWSSYDGAYAPAVRKRLSTASTRNQFLLCIGEGFHAATTPERLTRNFQGGDKLFECIIPAGAQYYEDDNDLIVSNQIIIKKML